MVDILIPQSPWLAPCPRCRAEGGSRLAGVCMECAAGDVAACAALRRLPARERAIVADVLGAAGLRGLERVARDG